MVTESFYFWEIQNNTIIKVYFLQNSPIYNYRILPASEKMLEKFMEDILWKPFQLLHRILNNVISITIAQSLQC
jgi:hypothetical protein